MRAPHEMRHAASTPTLRRSQSIRGRRRRIDECRNRALVTRAVEEREQWVTKQQLAVHLSVTPRWIVLQQAHGLPHMRMGGMNRYVLSEVEAWLRERYGQPRREAA